MKNLENFEIFGNFGNFWSALLYIDLPWFAWAVSDLYRKSLMLKSYEWQGQMGLGWDWKSQQALILRAPLCGANNYLGITSKKTGPINAGGPHRARTPQNTPPKFLDFWIFMFLEVFVIFYIFLFFLDFCAFFVGFV